MPPWLDQEPWRTRARNWTCPGLPGSIDEAFNLVDDNNPGIQQAIMTEQVTRERIRQAKAGAMPSISAFGSFGYANPTSPPFPNRYNREITAGVTVTQPLFTSGLIHAQIGEALENNTSARVQIEGARRTAIETVSQAWNTMVSSIEQTAAGEDAVAGARISSEGERKEYQAGLRSVLEVLIEEERLRDTQIALTQARFSGYLAQAQILSAIGRLTGEALLQPGAPLYDPLAHFKRVKHEGALPWEPVIAAIDNVGAPPVGRRRPVPAPAPAASPQLKPALTPPPPAGAYAANAPTGPLRGFLGPSTVAPNTPARLDSTTAPPATK